ncbi:DEAD/DEAH box helicase domain-containing protein [Lipingzhangella halophila]|uniref:DEAD/DEAH box helicase domain-containing protein n=1 Tax=Lipingzhangella halophila TaxID=1783352 RepID=A0A7W7RP59_9ACTN|nr:DEAD/DEAH box helicase [Lipingzhangella halophila]MBB4935628.1 DEAD/DEAH box helicase domain-containing protein [Lipingzhangella halophila]
MSLWESTLQRLWRDDTRISRVTHVERLVRGDGVTEDWPSWTPSPVLERLTELGITAPWSHQVAAADVARSGNNVIIATGTASGKSVAFLLPCAEAIAAGGTVLYLSPAKALAADQRRSLADLGIPGLRAATYDGDTPTDERAWVRAHANYVLTNPDMLHHAILARHASWAGFLRRLRYIVIDEAHRYRGVFGSHVAQIVRRLRRVCAHYRSAPVFILASATTGTPEESAAKLTGLPVRAITEDASPRSALSFAMVEPELTDQVGENGAPIRRTATAEAADILAELARAGVRTLAFVRSRQGAESVAMSARRVLGVDAPADPRSQGPPGGGEPPASAAPPPGVRESADGGTRSLADRVAAYRAGYLADERRELEAALRSGELLGLATTNALELGVDITGLDAVLITGWPGTRASLWQQAGRAGRRGEDAVAVFIARDDPLDTYLVHNPGAIFGRSVEATVLDPDNPYVLGPHLCAAASEIPLTKDDLALFGPEAEEVLAGLVERRMLRRRPRGWFWTRRDRASGLTDIRGGGGAPVQIVDSGSGQLLGTVDEAAAHGTVHTGAVYLHQGMTYLVDELDLDEGVALVRFGEPGYSTWARDVTEIEIRGVQREQDWAPSATVHFGEVEVTRQVVGYLKRDVRTGSVLGEQPLDLPERTLSSRAVWWTLSADAAESLRKDDVDLRGAAHAAEHAAIGLLPLFATCDRWDIGGVSTALHADTGRLTIFVYDGHEGGAGFAERGYAAARDWLTATREAIATCECADGCPSCIQSPKCGNGNDPLSKSGALRLLDTILERKPDRN